MIRYVSKPVNLDRQNTAHQFDTDGLLDETGDKLLSICNNGVEVAYIDKSGNISSPSIVNDLASHYVLAAGKFTTAGGDATETITATGATSSDIAIVTMQTLGTGSRTILAAAPGTNIITVTLSGDPSTNHILSWQVLRAV